MIDLQSAAGDALLADALGRNPLLALDFDGTLSPLVPIPEAAAMDPRVPPLLPPLIARMPVAIVSGRGLADLAARVPVKGVTLVGNHGNEWGPADGRDAAGQPGPGAERDARQRKICREWAAALAEPLTALGPGLAFETKTVSLSIHYRLVKDPPAMRAQLLALIATLEPAPEIIEGKFVFNLMAPGLVTKYEAVEELVARHGSGTAIFVGDDVTDERVFERAPPGWLTIRVWDDEAPAAGAMGRAGQSAARAFVHRVDGVVELLARMGRLTRNL
jgi:trehalose 6-phosphate phosphatase